MRSVNRESTRGAAAMRLLAVAVCLCLLGAGAAGCSTTQEKAAAKQLESERILKAQAKEKKAAKLKAGKKHHGETKSKGKK